MSLQPWSSLFVVFCYIFLPDKVPCESYRALAGNSGVSCGTTKMPSTFDFNWVKVQYLCPETSWLVLLSGCALL